ncbi:MAG TPA: PP2C family protein-serine/threonine phosphatase [Edaphobacter sp.]|jgi:sigma-B regulation protein RsbU (phosphoserine phosphatase)|nr:PP2C family protein-serine/threonine phosphatase [Edaphobacter sp.]
MYLADPELTASQVLRIFHHDEFYLFLGASFTALGLVAMAFAFLSRKFDAMLFWLALFAILYGQRLWLQSGLLGLLVPPSFFFSSLRESANYLVPIPAFFYFEAAGFLGRSGRKIATLLAIPFLGLFIATFFFGPRHEFVLTNHLLVIATLLALIIQSIRQKSPDRDFIIIRRGIAVFVAFALFDNILQALGHFIYIEPIGFAFFLATLGYVAATRSIHRDQQFGELQKELEIARRIQTDILPPSFPSSDHFKVAARYVPMTAVAGDFYDFLITGQQQAGLLIADVSGHGIPAALIASMVKLAATSQRANASNPAALLIGMNSVLHGNTQSQFVTAAYVYLDAATSTLSYSAAAHPPMLLLRAGAVIPVEKNGLMLAAFSFSTYETITYPIESGDRFLLYTDGLLEAANRAGEEFGSERLTRLLQNSAFLTADQAVDEIVSTLQNWSHAQNDDLTILICDYAKA